MSKKLEQDWFLSNQFFVRSVLFRLFCLFRFDGSKELLTKGMIYQNPHC
jgi:hypothetical protein